MDYLKENKGGNRNGHGNSFDDTNGSGNFTEEISFPFIPCNFNKHKKFGPQTVISHFTFDPLKNNYILFCNTCLKDLEKKNPEILYYDIEEFAESFLRKLSFGNLEAPIPSSQLKHDYEMKAHNIVTFKKRVEKEVQVIEQTFDGIIREVTRLILERRDHIVRGFGSVQDMFIQSYDLFNLKYEKLFKSGDKLVRLRETNEHKIKEDLQEVKTAEEYQCLMKELKELDDLCHEVTNREKKTEELLNFSTTLQSLYQILPPVPADLKRTSDMCLDQVREALDLSLDHSAFKNKTVIQQISSGLAGFSEGENNMSAGNLLKTIEISKKYWPKALAQSIENHQEHKFEYAKPPQEANTLDLADDAFATPMGLNSDVEEEGQILSVSINKHSDLEKINNPDITHLEVVSNEMDDELARALGKVVSEIRNLISVTFDFCGGGNHITDQGASSLLQSIRSHSAINNLLIDFSEGQNCVTNNTAQLLAEILSGFTKLDMLFINVCCGQNEVTDKGAIYLGKALHSLDQLTNLRLNFCGGQNVITDAGAIALCQPISNMRRLNYLLLKLCCGKNRLAEKGHQAMAACISQMSEIVGLTLATSGDKANDEGAYVICKSLERLTSLQALTLGFYENAMTDKTAEHIANSLRALKNLMSLRINICGGRKMITDAGVGHLSRALSELHNLTAITLSFYDNMLTDIGIAEISKGIADLRNLNTIALNLHGASISDSGAHSLSEFMKKSSNLNSLALIFSGGANKITDNGVNVLCFAIGNLVLLEYLTLDFSEYNQTLASLSNVISNQLTDNGANSISQSLRELESLGELTLCFDGNKISESGVNQLGSTISELKNLRSIMLFFANNPISRGLWEKLTSVMRSALPNSDISITWDNNYKS